MSPTGRPDSKYVRKVHFSYYVGCGSPIVTTGCGKRVLQRYATCDGSQVTCKTCQRSHGYWAWADAQ
jgi:hypothetical protein